MFNITSPANQAELVALRRQKELAAKLAFEGKRTDRNLVNELTTDNGALFQPKEREMINALKRLSEDSTTDNVKFLLHVAKNLKYGVRTGSALDRFLKGESSIKDKNEVQNVNWENLLKQSIEKALAGNNTKQKPALEKEFKLLFPQQAKENDRVTWLSVNPHLGFEKDLIALRNQILDTREFKESTDSENKVKARKHLDYFIASSEVAYPEKTECLKLLAHMMSDEYKINTQLKDKKVQALAEIINDVVIKTPEEAMLTIKEMSQESHGMCAAISTSRKAMAHEYKLAYVSNLVAELDDKPTMKVYDVTDPKDKDKITVEKANIDYKAALDQGYRIVDAAVSNWMHIANISGNGLTQVGQYIPFDVQNYGMFRDSHLRLNMAPEYQPAYDLLRATIKTRGVVKSLREDLTERVMAGKEIRDNEFESSTLVSINIRKVEAILKELSQDQNVNTAALADRIMKPDIISKEIQGMQVDIRKSDAQISKLEHELKESSSAAQKADLQAKLLHAKEQNARIKADLEPKIKKLENMAIDSSEGPKVKSEKIARIISEQMPGVAEQSIQQFVGQILDHYLFVEDMTDQLDSLQDKFSLKGQYKLQDKLFKFAAYNRVRKEFEASVPERLEAMSKELGVPAEKEAVLKALENKGEIFSRERLDAIKAELDKIKKYEKAEIKKGQPGWKSDTNLYKPLHQFKDDFKKIKSSLNGIRREVERDWLELNKQLDPQLQEVYDKAGKGKGHFWIGEEGSSGLHNGQYARLLKQQSGEDHFVTGDVKEALDHIQAGKSSGVTGTNVEHYGYSGHAQYVYDVKDEQILNPETGKVEDQRALYHDNTWGKRELKHVWTDDGGHERTDYGSKRGGPHGYLFDPTGTQGTPEIELITGTGIHKPDKIGKKWAEKFDSSIGSEFPMFMEIILKGKMLSAEEKATGLVGKMFGVNSEQNQQRVELLVNKLAMGQMPEIQKLSGELTISVYNTVFDAINNNKLDQLENNLTEVIANVTEHYPLPIFQPGGRSNLSEIISKNLPRFVNEILNTPDLPEFAKKVELSRIIENFVERGVLSTTKPGQAVNLAKAEQIEKSASKLQDKLIDFIRGDSSVSPGMDPEKMQRKGGIATKADFDALPDNNLIKILLNKMALAELSQNNETYMMIDSARTPEDLAKAKARIIENHKNEMREFFNKSEESIEYVGVKFLENASAAIEEVEQKYQLNLDSVKNQLAAITENIPAQCDGSVAKLQAQFDKAIASVVSNFRKDSGSENKEAAEVLNAKLTFAFDQTYNEMVKVDSMDDLKDSFLGQKIVHWIDTKFDPKSDEAFLKRINSIQNLDRKTFDKLLDKATPEELGLNFRDPFYTIQRIRGLNDKATKDFKTAVFHYVFNTLIQQKTDKDVQGIENKHKEWLKTREAKNMTPEQREQKLKAEINSYLTQNADLTALYRNMKVEFSYVGLDKFVAKEKDVALKKYGARPAFPVVKVVDDQTIKETVSQNLNGLNGMIMQLNQLKEAEAKTNKPEELAQIKEMFEQVQKSIKVNQMVMAKSLVRPRHRDDVMRMMNEWVKTESKNPGSSEAKFTREALEAKMQEDYILSYPEEFLETIAKEVPEMLQMGNKMTVIDANVLQNWKQGLLMCVQAAKKAQIEFKIKDYISKAKMPQIAKKLRDPESSLIQNTKTGDSIPLESKKGLEVVFKYLSDPMNNNSTLKYFVEQSGLTKAAIQYFLKGPRPEKIVEYVQKNVDQLNDRKAEQNIIQDQFEEFITDLLETKTQKLTVDDLEKVLKNYFAQLDKVFANQKIENSSTLSEYKHTLEENVSVAKALKAEPPEGDALNFILEWQEAILQKQDDYTEANIESAISMMNIAKERKAGLEMLSDLVPAYDEMKTTINEYIIGLDKAVQEIDKIRESLQAPILEKIIAREEANKAETAKAQEQVSNMSQEELQEIMVQQAQSAVQNLLKAINSGDQMAQKLMVKQLIDDQNPLLPPVLEKVLFEIDNPTMKAWSAGLLSQKGYIEPLINFSVSALDESGKIDRNITPEDGQAFILAIEGVIKGANSDDQKLSETCANVLGHMFVEACDHQNPTPFMDQLLNVFINGLVNQGEMVQSVLMNIIADPQVHNNAKCVATYVLGRYETMGYFNLFEDIIMKPEKFADKPSEKLFLLDVALQSLTNMASKYQGLNYSRALETIKSVNIQNMVANAKKEPDSEASQIDGAAKRIQESIEKLEKVLKGEVSKEAA
jgi:hypothetical protein